MFWSKAFIPTLKETPQEAEIASHKLMLRAGMVRMLMAGAYTYLPLGLRVLNNIEKIIREEMDACAANELLLPALQPLELWQKSGRDKDIGEVMIRFTDRRGRKLALGPTHEEVITDLIRGHLSSYKQLPLVLYQIQTKFRDEIRPRFGLIRSCEFIMKDAYSFDADEEGLENNYKTMFEAYKRIFERCGLKTIITQADPGVMGGNLSHEFMVSAKDGEDVVLLCPVCKTAIARKEKEKPQCIKCKTEMEEINTIEIGHIFKLEAKYSSVLGANFLNAKGELKPVIMGCYGIGVSRMLSAIIEQNNDENGIIWPREVAPYKIILLALDVTDKEIMDLSLDIYKELKHNAVDMLFDDRNERAGVKFKDADLLGIPLQIIIGKEALKSKHIELKLRRGQRKISVLRNELKQRIGELLNG